MPRGERRRSAQRVAGPRPAFLALVSVLVTAATVAGGSWLVSTPDERLQVTVGDSTVDPLPDDVDPGAPLDDDPVSAAAGVPALAAADSSGFDRAQHSPRVPGSPWVVVNKRHALPPDHTPELTTVRGHRVAVRAAVDLTRMLDDAEAAGLGLRIVSAHRSYARQQAVYSRAVASRGTASADALSARPGHSEHQTGLAVDVSTSHVPSCELRRCFGETTAGRWVASEAWRYGFIVRYTGANRGVTGFAHEPWHLRHVGRELAAEMQRTGTSSLEEFLGVRGGDYR